MFHEKGGFDLCILLLGKCEKYDMLIVVFERILK